MSWPAHSREPEPRPAPPATPTMELGVRGPRGQEGFLLRAPQHEALLWDLESEVASPRRCRVEERDAWWIEATYQESVVDIVLRSFSSVMILHTGGEDRLLSRDGVVAVQGRIL